MGAVGIRKEGTLVIASNVVTRHPTPSAHAEARVTKKLNDGSTIYVVRISRKEKLCLARPCKSCRTTMRNRGVKRCYYSISENEYGVLDLTS